MNANRPLILPETLPSMQSLLTTPIGGCILLMDSDFSKGNYFGPQIITTLIRTCRKRWLLNAVWQTQFHILVCIPTFPIIPPCLHILKVEKERSKVFVEGQFLVYWCFLLSSSNCREEEQSEFHIFAFQSKSES